MQVGLFEGRRERTGEAAPPIVARWDRVSEAAEVFEEEAIDAGIPRATLQRWMQSIAALRRFTQDDTVGTIGRAEILGLCRWLRTGPAKRAGFGDVTIADVAEGLDRFFGFLGRHGAVRKNPVGLLAVLSVRN